ncbi:hypothetical protein [Nocardia macrotermitis]|uniref:Uncharacterized protein n=1 Tax=Nocardia macrotermitis TaxID=2585198 RepID=A0A7K0D224_9NOCA|nr:hypothetical protein [Nocardia macrotermitis]MQY19757.1 hypothetical protein [Nocardia macrotermitis]
MIITVLAQNTTTNPTGPEFGKASPLGLVIVLILLAGTVLLIRSMNKHIKGLPADFSPEHPEPDQAADEGTDPGVAEIGTESESESAEPESDAAESAASNSKPPRKS